MALKTAADVAAAKTKDLKPDERFVLPPPGDVAEAVVITRMVFEALAARAGVSVQWRDGQAYMTQQDNYLLDLPPTVREIEKRCRQLEAENARLTERLKSAATRDDNWRDIMKELAEADRRVAALRAETKAKQDLADHGISEADQAAAAALLGIADPVALRDTLARPAAPKRAPSVFDPPTRGAIVMRDPQ